jgi:hypothetical protein
LETTRISVRESEHLLSAHAEAGIDARGPAARRLLAHP